MKPASPIHAELSGDDTCIAFDITVRADAPVLALCRRLVAAGFDPATPLEAWRGAELCLRVRSIGEGARLRVRSDDRNGGAPRFVPYAPPTASPAARTGAPATQVADDTAGRWRGQDFKVEFSTLNADDAAAWEDRP